jgi:hypothetical protein
MTEAETYADMLSKMAAEVEQIMSEVPADRLFERPGPSLNSVGWNYWHALRIWDLRLNHQVKGQDPLEDAWHRYEFSARSGYNPDGTGARGAGLGMGQSDAEVDRVHVAWPLIIDYQQTLLAESLTYLSGMADASDFDRQIPAGGDSTISVREIYQQMIRQFWMHYGEMRYAKGMLGLPDPTYPGRS